MYLVRLKTARELLFTLLKYLISFHSHQIFKLISNYFYLHQFDYLEEFKISTYHQSNFIDFEICPKVFVNLS